jgi:hypothetical protein
LGHNLAKKGGLWGPSSAFRVPFPVAAATGSPSPKLALVWGFSVLLCSSAGAGPPDSITHYPLPRQHFGRRPRRPLC